MRRPTTSRPTTEAVAASASNQARRPGLRWLAGLLYAALIVCLSWTAVFLAWGSLRAVDFGYPLLYELQGIDAHIARYAPANRFRQGFEASSREQRLALFAAINDAVHDGGRGLEALRYTDAQGRSVQFLRKPEIIHLRSVARLLDQLGRVSWLMLGGLALTLALLRAGRLPPPRSSRVLAWSAVVVLAAAGFVLAWGPEEVFNTLHAWVFPAGEQWFFYYEESLMTTLMKAPDLFGGIAVLLLALAAVYFAALLLVCRALLRRLLTPGRG